MESYGPAEHEARARSGRDAGTGTFRGPCFRWCGSAASPLVREGGVEPPRPFGHTDLNRARLPIPPLARAREASTAQAVPTRPARGRAKPRLHDEPCAIAAGASDTIARRDVRVGACARQRRRTPGSGGGGVGVLQRFERRLEQHGHGAFAKAFRSAVQPVEIAAALQREVDNSAADPLAATGAWCPTTSRRARPRPTTSGSRRTPTRWRDELDRDAARARRGAALRLHRPGHDRASTSDDDLATGRFRVRSAGAARGQRRRRRGRHRHRRTARPPSSSRSTASDLPARRRPAS